MRSEAIVRRVKRRFLAPLGMTLVMRVALLALAICGYFATNICGQVTSQRLLESAKEPQNWLMYSGDYAGHRYSALDQINMSNAALLVPKWAYDDGGREIRRDAAGCGWNSLRYWTG